MDHLAVFKQKFVQLRDMGFVKSLRRGPTGIGYTFETLMGIVENNAALPDFEGYEIKAHRSGSNSLITLFTFNRKAWKIPPLTAIQKYGSIDSNGRLGLYYTIKRIPNSVGLYTYIEDDSLSVRHVSGEIVVSWTIADMVAQFSKKISKLLFISARSEQRGDAEYFHYYRAQRLEETSEAVLIDQFINENITIDVRLHDAVTRARNHGTAFRVYEDKLPLLFKKVEDL